MMCAFDDDWEELLLMDSSNLCVKFTKSTVHSSRTEGEYFKLCKILREFPGKFREYYRMNIPTSVWDLCCDNFCLFGPKEAAYFLQVLSDKFCRLDFESCAYCSRCLARLSARNKLGLFRAVRSCWEKQASRIGFCAAAAAISSAVAHFYSESVGR
jgi:hypothetical protein